MSEPTVCAIMLTRDRPELANKAVECFRAQTYPNKSLLIWDTSGHPEAYSFELPSNEWCVEDLPDYSIGELRNRAARWTTGPYETSDILVHWDDDDYSHPNRIAEQVALLQSSGADVVGYNELLFWRDDGHAKWTKHPDNCVCGTCGPGERRVLSGPHPGEAWLYTATLGCAPALGTSLCYWRKTWEKSPFPDQPSSKNSGSEYGNWLKALNCKAVSPFPVASRIEAMLTPHIVARYQQPRMIARIHAGNSQRHAYDLEEVVRRGSHEWKRVPEWDERIREILA